MQESCLFKAPACLEESDQQLGPASLHDGLHALKGRRQIVQRHRCRQLQVDLRAAEEGHKPRDGSSLEDLIPGRFFGEVEDCVHRLTKGKRRIGRPSKTQPKAGERRKGQEGLTELQTSPCSSSSAIRGGKALQAITTLQLKQRFPALLSHPTEASSPVPAKSAMASKGQQNCKCRVHAEA